MLGCLSDDTAVQLKPLLLTGSLSDSRLEHYREARTQRSAKTVPRKYAT